MMIKLLISVLSYSCLLFSCKPKPQGSNSTPTAGNESKIEQIVLDTFSTFPSEIDGCACYFSNDETAFKNKKYIYADDFGNMAFISIDGVMNKFEINQSDTFPVDRLVHTFNNDKYEITIDVTQVGQVDETWQKKGTIKIKSKAGQEIIQNIYGECGC